MSGAAKCWLKLVEMLLDIWCERHQLEKIEIRVHYTPLARDRGWSFEEAGHHRCVMGLLSRVSGAFSILVLVLVLVLSFSPGKRTVLRVLTVLTELQLRGFGEQVPMVFRGDVPQERMKRKANLFG